MQENLNDIIRDYLKNQLPPAEKTAFEQRLSDDPDFAIQAAEAATLQAGIEAEGDRELEAKLLSYSKELNQMNATVFSSPPTSINIRKLTSYSRMVYAAAVLIGLIVVVLPLWLMNRSGSTITASPKEIYANNFTIPPVPEARSNDEPVQWRQSYARADYKTTAAQLEGLLSDATFTGRSEAFYYLGIAQMALGNFDAAHTALEQVREESFDWESAQWYSALALLQLNKMDAAKQLFDQISKQNTHPNQRQAKAILEGL